MLTTLTMSFSCETVWHLFSVAQLESTTLSLNCGWASRLCCAPVGPATLHHNKHVHHSIQELHLWNLHCPRNCLEGRFLVLLHNLARRRFSRWYASRCAPGNGLDHFHCFFHDLWYGDVGSPRTGPLTDSLMWDPTAAEAHRRSVRRVTLGHAPGTGTSMLRSTVRCSTRSCGMALRDLQETSVSFVCEQPPSLV